MKTVLIGAGNVATHLGLAIKSAGMNVVQVWSRTLASARQLGDMLGCGFTADMDEVVRDADLYIISVSDDALRGVVEALCPSRREAVFVHTAGSMPMDIFSGCADCYGVLYPMQTFSKAKEIDFKKVPVLVEASSSEVMHVVESFAGKITDTVCRLDSEGRKWLHLAAVFACNFSNYCCSVAYDLLQKRGIPFSVMLPLVTETAGKLSALTPREAQTGPAARGDVKLLEEQEKMLACDDRLAQIYRLVSQGIMHNRNKG